MDNLNCRLCGNAGSTAMIGSEVDDRIEVGHLVCDNLNCANGGSWNPNPPEPPKMTQQEFLNKVTALIKEYETQHEDGTESVIGCILTLEDAQTIFEWNGCEMERIPDMYIRKIPKTEEEIEDRKENPGDFGADGKYSAIGIPVPGEVELDDGSTVSVATNRMAEFQAMIDASIIKAENRGIGLMESTVLTWEQQFEIGGPFTFDEEE